MLVQHEPNRGKSGVIVKRIDGLEQIPDALRGCVLTIGNFDGVHRGHQQILAQAGLLQASLFGARTHHKVVVLTFDPHPLEIVSPGRAPERLMPLSEKVCRLAEAGADAVVVAKSEPVLLSLEPHDFIENVIERKFKPSHVVEGWSFGFGKGRKGNADVLRDLGAQHGFEVFIVEPVRLQVADDETVLVTSSMIRDLIRTGQVDRAHLCMGRPYALFGEVATGHGRGSKLGYPTANLAQIDQLIPAEGVYAGKAEVCGGCYDAAISIGTTPTFGDSSLQVEAFLLDCSVELFGRPMKLEFLRFLRSQQRFESPEALTKQIEQDVRQVRVAKC
ncbi:MAG: bifunctional riboflavin kinase/FAD synthetase [Planctomycetes bacterium]|nr:bifunctional riboflavin kinase/FAD synthetase [Planctomycetota bacterium]